VDILLIVVAILVVAVSTPLRAEIYDKLAEEEESTISNN
jgi:hypothetical protein